MNPVALDAELVSKLTANGGHVALTDANGNAIGHFLSPEVYESFRRAVLEHASSEVSLADFRRALANPNRHTMDEVLKLVEGE